MCSVTDATVWATKGFWLHVLLRRKPLSHVNESLTSPVELLYSQTGWARKFSCVIIHYRVLIGYPEIDFEDFFEVWVSDNVFKCFKDISIQQVVLISFSLASVFLILSNCHARSFFQREFPRTLTGSTFLRIQAFFLENTRFLGTQIRKSFPSRLSAQD